ncbi:hypothetical protein R1flu_007944 [Riccia fluitans]|uniref:Secreted protein n=1 Tax=Riccia fluitans TaxID=41844 RepID=A0ABD1XDM8_9MARC
MQQRLVVVSLAAGRPLVPSLPLSRSLNFVVLLPCAVVAWKAPSGSQAESPELAPLRCGPWSSFWSSVEADLDTWWGRALLHARHGDRSRGRLSVRYCVVYIWRANGNDGGVAESSVDSARARVAASSIRCGFLDRTQSVPLRLTVQLQACMNHSAVCPTVSLILITRVRIKSFRARSYCIQVGLSGPRLSSLHRRESNFQGRTVGNLAQLARRPS